MADDEYDKRFWNDLDQLVVKHKIVIDRPKGSAHPRFDSIVYPLNYGYLEGTSAIDGNGVDVWVGSVPDPRVVGALVTVDLYKRDAEIKILVGCTEDEIQLPLGVSNTESQSAILLRRF